MQYYVVAPDGQKYGPADVETLVQWAGEGRVQAETILESAVDGTRVPAASVPGVIAPGQNPYQNPPQFSTYGQAVYGDDGSGDVTKAWIFGTLGFLCCPIIFSVLGIYYGNLATKKGNPRGQAAMIFSIVTLVLGIGVNILLQGASLLTGWR